MTNRLSQETLAELAQVTQGTVSRALRNDPRVSVPVRNRIRHLARQHGYTVNTLASSLRRKSTSTIGLVFSVLRYTKHIELINTLVELLDDRQYSTALRLSGWDSDKEARCLDELLGMQVSGVIMFASSEVPNKGAIARVPRRGIPVIVIDMQCDLQDVDHLFSGVEQAAYEEMKHLFSIGRRRIAAILPERNSFTVEARYRAFHRAYYEAGLNPESATIVNCGLGVGYEEGYRSALKLLEKTQPDAVFCTNDEIAIGAIKAFKRQGLSIPGDIAITGFDNIPCSEYCDVPLTTADFPAKALAAVAVERLLGRVEYKGKQEAGVVSVPHQLIIRESTIGDDRYHR